MLAMLATVLIVWMSKEKPRADKFIEPDDIGGCIANLRKLHHAIKLYQADWGSDGVYGDTEKMGLPAWPLTADFKLDMNDKYICPRTPNELVGRPGFPYGYAPIGIHSGNSHLIEATSLWEKASLVNREHSVLFFDPNHNPPGTLFSPMARHFVFGICLDGNLVKRYLKGMWSDIGWKTNSSETAQRTKGGHSR